LLPPRPDARSRIEAIVGAVYEFERMRLVDAE